MLANEEVIDGKSERGGFPVFRRPMRQWMLRITAYADRLIDELEGLNWPESIKALQRNWIGRSEGAEIYFDSAAQTEGNCFYYPARYPVRRHLCRLVARAPAGRSFHIERAKSGR